MSGHFPLARNIGFGSFTANGVLSYVRGKTTSGTDDNLYNIMPLNARLSLTQRLGDGPTSPKSIWSMRNRTSRQSANEIETPGYALLNLRSSYAWKKARLDVGIDNVFDRLYYYPLGGAYVGQGITMPPNQTYSGVPVWGTAVPGMGRSIYAGLNIQF